MKVLATLLKIQEAMLLEFQVGKRTHLPTKQHKTQTRKMAMIRLGSLMMHLLKLTSLEASMETTFLLS